MAKIGRPTKYKPEYCDTVIEVMEKGFSKEAVAGHIGISKDTLYKWIKKHEEFSDSIKRGVEISRVFWEELGIEMVTAGQGNAASWIFNMKNRFGWKDKKEITGAEGQPLGVVILPQVHEDNMETTSRPADRSSKKD